MAYRKLGRTSSQRKALLRDLTTDLIINERIVTTEARAEEGEKIVVETALQKLFNDLASRYNERQGGYTRILKTEPRRGDAAPMVIIELV